MTAQLRSGTRNGPVPHDVQTGTGFSAAVFAVARPAFSHFVGVLSAVAVLRARGLGQACPDFWRPV